MYFVTRSLVEHIILFSFIFLSFFSIHYLNIKMVTSLQNSKCKNNQQREYWVLARGAEQLCRVLCWESRQHVKASPQWKKHAKRIQQTQMSFIFATRVAIPFDPTSHVPKSFCGWEPWGTHLRDPKGKGPPGEFQRQETLTAPQGPAVTAEPGWSALTAPLTSPVPSLSGNFSLLACDCQGSATCSRGPAHAAALLLPGWTTVGEPRSQCLWAFSHCYSTRTKTESRLDKRKTVIALLTLAVISCSLCQFVLSTYFLLCVD